MRCQARILAAAGLLLAAVAGHAESLSGVLEENLRARGGVAAWRAVDTLRILGVMALPDGSSVPVSLEMKRPNKLRMEFQLQGQTGIRTFDGVEGWSWLPFDQDLEPALITDAQAAELAQTADFDGPLIDWRDKGYSLQYLGLQDTADGRAGHLLELTRINGDSLRLFLDPETFLEFRQLSQAAGGGQPVVTDLRDYRPIGDLMMPYVLDVAVAGPDSRQILNIDAIELNPVLEDARFTMRPDVVQSN